MYRQVTKFTVLLSITAAALLAATTCGGGKVSSPTPVPAAVTVTAAHCGQPTYGPVARGTDISFDGSRSTAGQSTAQLLLGLRRRHVRNGRHPDA
jgi:hypothetical protein